MMFNLQAACGCEIGRIRSNNEDNFFFDGIILPMNNPGLGKVLSFEGALCDPVCFGVFDGMGGEAFGEEAAYLAAKTLLSYAKAAEAVDLHRVIQEANGKVCRASMNHNMGVMGSTAVMLQFSGGQATVLNVGDSKAFLFRNNGLKQVSVDHTDQAILNQYKITNRKPRLTQHLGIDPAEMTIEPYSVAIDTQLQDQFLLCSDGLSDMVGIERIEGILLSNYNPTTAVESLMKEALENGGKDNITVILCKVVL